MLSSEFECYIRKLIRRMINKLKSHFKYKKWNSLLPLLPSVPFLRQVTAPSMKHKTRLALTNAGIATNAPVTATAAPGAGAMENQTARPHPQSIQLTSSKLKSMTSNKTFSIWPLRSTLCAMLSDRWPKSCTRNSWTDELTWESHSAALLCINSIISLSLRLCIQILKS